MAIVFDSEKKIAVHFVKKLEKGVINLAQDTEKL